ncbi:hypothetical protein Hypma_005837 [Hypsizygus marmoreus]|uniref:Uncharacterized protein n=1 Tax=Hypsizygus marmoreus TaxID=39966 RepID=A0A369KFY7_HYPMA|nr:hypothetical protein Hypma_005837 [Hypsizygus marmoreus]
MSLSFHAANLDIFPGNAKVLDTWVRDTLWARDTAWPAHVLLADLALGVRQSSFRLLACSGYLGARHSVGSGDSIDDTYPAGGSRPGNGAIELSAHSSGSF